MAGAGSGLGGRWWTGTGRRALVMLAAVWVVGVCAGVRDGHAAWEKLRHNLFDLEYPVHFRSVVHDGERFVAVGWYGFIATSTDGVSWVRHKSDPENSEDVQGNSLDAVAWNGETDPSKKLFVAVGWTSAFWSADGKQWTRVRGVYGNDVTYAGGRWFAYGARGVVPWFNGSMNVFSSADGKSWTPSVIPQVERCVNKESGLPIKSTAEDEQGGIDIMKRFEDRAKICEDPDGEGPREPVGMWVSVDAITRPTWTVPDGHAVFDEVTGDPVLRRECGYNPNGCDIIDLEPAASMWLTRNLVEAGVRVNSVTYRDGVYLALASDFWVRPWGEGKPVPPQGEWVPLNFALWSRDGVFWERILLDDTITEEDISFAFVEHIDTKDSGGRSQYVAIDGERVWLSERGIEWRTARESFVNDTIERTSYDRTLLRDISQVGAKIWIVGDGGLFAWSTDGVSWTDDTFAMTVRGAEVKGGPFVPRIALADQTGRTFIFGNGGLVLKALPNGVPPREPQFPTVWWQWARSSLPTDLLVLKKGTPTDLKIKALGMSYGDGRFVAVGEKGMAGSASRSRGWEWWSQSLVQNNYNGVAQGIGRFLVAGDATAVVPTVLVGEVGDEQVGWSSRTAPADVKAALRAASVGTRSYYVAGDQGALLHSCNTRDWLSGPDFGVALGSLATKDMVFDGVQHLGVGNGGWWLAPEQCPLLPGQTVEHEAYWLIGAVQGFSVSTIAYGDNRYVGFADGEMWVSPDGGTWFRGGAMTAIPFGGVTADRVDVGYRKGDPAKFLPGHWVASRSLSERTDWSKPTSIAVISSLDGQFWTDVTPRNLPVALLHNVVSTGDAFHVFGEERVLIETDGPSPFAFDDMQYSVEFGRVLTVDAPGVLSNDRDPMGLALTVPAGSVNKEPLKGELVMNEDGSFTYTPPPGFVGDVVFTYQASNGEQNSNDATVIITVEQPPPVYEGWDIYGTFCSASVCHGPLQATDVPGASVADIQQVHSLSDGKHTASLSAEEVLRLAEALPSSSQEGGTGGWMYTTFCANCHGPLDSTSIVVRNWYGLKKGLEGDALMRRVPLGDAELPVLSTTLAAVPTNGKALYERYCQTDCHGPIAKTSIKASRTAQALEAGVSGTHPEVVLDAAELGLVAKELPALATDPRKDPGTSSSSEGGGGGGMCFLGLLGSGW